MAKNKNDVERTIRENEERKQAALRERREKSSNTFEPPKQHEPDPDPRPVDTTQIEDDE